MSLKKIRRRLSQTFRFSIESSLSELAEHLTIDESNGEVKNNGTHSIIITRVIIYSALTFSSLLSLFVSLIQECTIHPHSQRTTEGCRCLIRESLMSTTDSQVELILLFWIIIIVWASSIAYLQLSLVWTQVFKKSWKKKNFPFFRSRLFFFFPLSVSRSFVPGPCVCTYKFSPHFYWGQWRPISVALALRFGL